MKHGESSAAREEILARLQQQAREATLPPPWQSRRDFPNLADRFQEALTAAKGEVVRAANLEDALQALGDLLSALGVKRVVVNGELAALDVDWQQRWPAIAWQTVAPAETEEERKALRAFCAEADLGLSGADAALAETGTVVVSSGAERSRLATLLPPVHVALVPEAKLTSDIFTWVAQQSPEDAANIVLISGPSKTADIEQTLTIGVHGPKRLIVILYG